MVYNQYITYVHRCENTEPKKYPAIEYLHQRHLFKKTKKNTNLIITAIFMKFSLQSHISGRYKDVTAANVQEMSAGRCCVGVMCRCCVDCGVSEDSTQITLRKISYINKGYHSSPFKHSSRYF